MVVQAFSGPISYNTEVFLHTGSENSARHYRGTVCHTAWRRYSVHRYRSIPLARTSCCCCCYTVAASVNCHRRRPP